MYDSDNNKSNNTDNSNNETAIVNTGKEDEKVKSSVAFFIYSLGITTEELKKTGISIEDLKSKDISIEDLKSKDIDTGTLTTVSFIIGLIVALIDKENVLGGLIAPGITLSISIFSIYYALVVYVLGAFKEIDTKNMFLFYCESKRHNRIIAKLLISNICFLLINLLKVWDLLKNKPINLPCDISLISCIICKFISDGLLIFSILYSISLLRNLSEYLHDFYLDKNFKEAKYKAENKTEDKDKQKPKDKAEDMVKEKDTKNAS